MCLDKKGLAALPAALQRQVLRAALAVLAGDARDIEAVHIEAARSLLGKPAGKEVSLPRGLVCRGGYDELTIARPSATTSRESGAEASMAPLVAGFSPAGGRDGGGRRSRPYGDKSRAGRAAPLAPCLLPFLSGQIPLKIPGETLLPGWRVTASIVPRTASACHGEPRSLRAWQSPEVSADSLDERSPQRLPRRPDSIGTPGNDGEESSASTPDPLVARNDGEESPPDGLVAHFDLRKAGTELFVRRRLPGDRFRPLGMSLPKKLQDFMVDARIPRAWRQSIPIVCSPQQIIWVVGWRIDDRVKVTGASREVLRLEFERSG